MFSTSIPELNYSFFNDYFFLLTLVPSWYSLNISAHKQNFQNLFIFVYLFSLNKTILGQNVDKTFRMKSNFDGKLWKRFFFVFFWHFRLTKILLTVKSGWYLSHEKFQLGQSIGIEIDLWIEEIALSSSSRSKVIG